MPAAFVEKPAPFSADFGVPVSFAGSPAGLLCIEDDFQDLMHFRGGVPDRAEPIGETRALLMPQTLASGLTPGQSIIVDGTGYLVNAPLAWKDGVFAIVTLADAS